MTKTVKVTKITGRLTYNPPINKGKVPGEVREMLRMVPASADEKKALLDQEAAKTQWCCMGIKPLDGSDFVDVFCFESLADKVSKFRAGDVVAVEVDIGRVREREWTGRDGTIRTTVQHVARKVVRPRKLNMPAVTETETETETEAENDENEAAA